MLPNLIVIGAAKCGTTSLNMYLDAHPSIHMSPDKEPRFFAPADGVFAGPRVGDRAEYERLFESPLPVRGEASPSYTQYPIHEGVPERIHEAIPDARIVYLVGDPIRRIVSQHVQRIATGAARGPLEDAIGDVSAPANVYVCPSRYGVQLERYLELFPPEQILVVDQDDLAQDRSETLSRIFGFLGVDPHVDAPEFAAEANRGAEHQELPASYFAARDGALGRILDRVPAGLRPRLVGIARRAVGRPIERPTLDPGLRSALESQLRGGAERLRELTGQPFAGWSV